jgi:hypothetical protein
MKLVQLSLGHPKNTEAMQRMCASYNIEYELTFDKQRLLRGDYTIAWIIMEWISPDELPPHVYILYGPQFFVLPEGPLCGALEERWANRCVYTCLSQWNIGVYAEFTPSFVIPIKPYFFGVSDQIQDLSIYEKSLDCIVYVKRRDPYDVMRVQEELDKRHLTYEVFEYGYYKNDEYFQRLQVAKFVIWLGTHESQGYCFQETLLTNTPILLWDATSMFFEYTNGMEFEKWYGTKELKSTTANLWSDECGVKMDEHSISESIESMVVNYRNFKPRDFILEHASDKVCMGRILSHFGLLTE